VLRVLRSSVSLLETIVRAGGRTSLRACARHFGCEPLYRLDTSWPHMEHWSTLYVSRYSRGIVLWRRLEQSSFTCLRRSVGLVQPVACVVSAHGHVAIGQKSLPRLWACAAGRLLVLLASGEGGPLVSIGAGVVAAALGCVASLVGPISLLLPGRRPCCSGSTLPPTGKGGMFEARALAAVATAGVAAGAASVGVVWSGEVVAAGGVSVAAATVRADVVCVWRQVHLTLSV